MRRSSYLLAAVLTAGCQIPTAPSRVPVLGTTSTVQSRAPDDCSERDPQQWHGFTYRISLEEVIMYNSSSCDRWVTWRAFNVQGSGQVPAGDAAIVLLPAGAGYGAPGSRLERPWVERIPYYLGVIPCVVQIDGRAGAISDMGPDNASFIAGRLFAGDCRVPVPSTPVPGTTVPVIPRCPAVLPGRVHGNPVPGPGGGC